MNEADVETPAAIRLRELDADGSNRSRVILAALELVEEFGTDSLTIAMLVERSGVSRATIYSHFGSVAGAVATVWAEIGSLWLQDAIVSLSDPDLDVPLVDILVTARREPELREVVLPDIALAREQLSSLSAIAELKSVWRLMSIFGMVLSRAIFPAVDDYEPFAQLIASLPDDLQVGPLHPRPENFPAVSSTWTWFNRDDPTRRRLLEASEHVVSAAGYKAASMQRICRSARLTTGATNPRFSSLLDLHLEAFNAAINTVVRDNAEQVSHVLPSMSPEDVFAFHMIGVLAPSREIWRNYRQEILYAARVTPDLAAGVQASFDRANLNFAEAMLALGVPAPLVDIAVVVSQIVQVGAPVVHGLGLPFAALDHRPILRTIANLAKSD
jgi:AcrR family transcriptional regulator